MEADKQLPDPPLPKNATVAEEWEYLKATVGFEEGEEILAKRSFYAGMFAAAISIRESYVRDDNLTTAMLNERAKGWIKEAFDYIFGEESAKEDEREIAAGR